jgi:hypothetical protein
LPSVLIIPPGGSFSPFENLIYPFEDFLWLSLFVVVVLGILIIFLYERIFHSSLNVFFIDVMTVIVGGSQKHLPQKHHKRIILASFLLFTLVIRSLYQGALFEFLRGDKRHKEIHSIDEMLKKGFSFYMYPAYEQHTKDMKFYSR